MLITKITRSYSKSINAKNYGLPESWIRVEAEYEVEPETGDDPIHCSEVTFDAAKKDVMRDVNDIIEKMKQAAQQMRNVASGNSLPIAPAPAPPVNQPSQTAPFVPQTQTVPVQPQSVAGTGDLPKTNPFTANQDSGAILPAEEINEGSVIKSNIGPNSSVRDDMAEINRHINQITDGGKNPGALFPDSGNETKAPVRPNPEVRPTTNGPRPL